MHFKLTEEQLMIQKAARDFAQNELINGVIERDTHKIYPKEQLQQMGELGFMGMMVKAEYGGTEMDTMSYVLAKEEISKVDNSCSVTMSIQNSLICSGIQNYASEELKQKYLPGLASGEVIGAFLLSEPEAGSDATSQRTTAEDKGDHFLINGTKNWISNGKYGGLFIVIAQTDIDKGHKGINAIIVDPNTDGITTGELEEKMGVRSSDTCSVMFQDVKVPKENLIGSNGFGFKFAMKILSGGRIGIAAQALGIAGGAYELAVAYSKQRSAFGKTINQHQAIAFKLADMATKIEAAKMMVYRAAWMKDQGLDYSQASAMAKLYASEIAQTVTSEAVQIHGGYGYVKEYHVERLMRDAKITQIYEGTSEIQKIVISRGIEKGGLYLGV
ncbi:MAG: acyl-CoA dehydrogenase [Saprospiraceae bacterium]|nr:acyl-CoA dehydrogenase [Saprospiraceae bacterium]